MAIIEVQKVLIILVIATLLTGLPQLISFIQVTLFGVSLNSGYLVANGYRPALLTFKDSFGPTAFHRFIKAPFYPFICHVIPALVYGPLAILQFSPNIRAKYPSWHRLGGYIFVVMSMLLVIGVAGMESKPNMTFSFGLWHEYIFTLTLISYILMVWFTLTLAVAIWHIRHKRVKLHQIWMTRHVLAGMAVGMQRIFLFLGVFLVSNSDRINSQLGFDLVWRENEISEIQNKFYFGFVGWLGGLICFVMGELFVLGLRAKNK